MIIHLFGATKYHTLVHTPSPIFYALKVLARRLTNAKSPILPFVFQLSKTEDAPYWHLLNIFAFGTYSDYKGTVLLALFSSISLYLSVFMLAVTTQ